MADLASLMRVAPISGAGMIGAQNTQEMQSEALRQQQLKELISGLQQAREQSSAMNPLLVEHQRLVNQGMGADLPGRAADSELKGLKAKRERATVDSDIENALSKNGLEVQTNNIKMLKQVGETLTSLAPYIETVPENAPGARAQALLRATESMGLSFDNPRARPILQIFSQVPSAQLPTVLRAVGENAIKQSDKYINEMDKVKEQSRSHLAGIGMQVQGQKDLEKMRIDAGKYEKKQISDDLESQIDLALSKAKSAPDQYAILSRAAALALQANNPALAMKYQTQMQAIEKQAQAQINAPKPGGINVPAVSGMPGIPQADIRSPASLESPTQIPSIQQQKIPTLSEVQKMYPGVPPEKLKEAYKKKFGVDLK